MNLYPAQESRDGREDVAERQPLGGQRKRFMANRPADLMTTKIGLKSYHMSELQLTRGHLIAEAQGYGRHRA